MIISISCPSVSIALYFKEEFLTELVAGGLQMSIDRFISSKSVMQIMIGSVFMFNEGNNMVSS